MNIITKQETELNKSAFVSNSNMNWYVFYTSPRSEKVVLKELIIRGYKAFLPTTKTLSVWKNGQKKMIEKVLFPSYIFVYAKENELHNIRQIPKISNFIHNGGKPSKIDNRCIEGINQMMNLNQEIIIEYDFCQGEKVRIIDGPLAGQEGVLLTKKSKARFGIQLKDINQTVFVDICTSKLEKVK